MLRILVGAALVVGAVGCSNAQSGVPVALVKHTEIKGAMATTRSVIFLGSLDNTQCCLWTMKQFRSDRDQCGDPKVVELDLRENLGRKKAALDDTPEFFGSQPCRDFSRYMAAAPVGHQMAC